MRMAVHAHKAWSIGAFIFLCLSVRFGWIDLFSLL